MNVILPVIYKMANYIVEFNEPDSTPEPKDYLVRIESVKGNSESAEQMDEQAGKEFTFKASDPFTGDISQPLDLIIKTYADHIAKDVNKLNRV
jgi:hypothetical protein